MPYIPNIERAKYNGYIKNITNILNRYSKHTKLSGQLHYIITKILLNTNPMKYDDYNTLIGVLENIKLELYRRKIIPYEDIKIKENGDVYR